MNRWVLLEHKIIDGNLIDIHYDFLVEDQTDCLTWKFHEIPSLNNGSVKIEFMSTFEKPRTSGVFCLLHDG